MDRARLCTRGVICNKEQKHGQGKSYEEHENWKNNVL
jgi:hypothetical protein